MKILDVRDQKSDTCGANTKGNTRRPQILVDIFQVLTRQTYSNPDLYILTYLGDLLVF